MLRRLIRKELRLQRGNMVFAGCVGLLSLVLLAVSFAGRPGLQLYGCRIPDLVQIGHYFAIVPLLLIVFPFMAGAVAVAEERKSETAEWQLAQPASRRKQWLAKTAVALGISLFVGGIVLSLLDALLVFHLQNAQAMNLFVPEVIQPQLLVLRRIWPGFYSLLFAALGIYASSTAADPYRAFMGGVALAVLGFLAHWSADPGLMTMPAGFGPFPEYFLHPGLHYLRIALLALALLALAYRNFGIALPKLSRCAFHVALWLGAVALAGWANLRAEMTVPEAKPTSPAGLPPGLSPLFVAQKGPGPSYPYRASMLFRVPASDRLLMLLQTDVDIARTWRSRDGCVVHVFDVNVTSGLVGQYTSIVGDILDIDRSGRFFVLYSPWEALYAVSRVGMPMNLSTTLGRMLGKVFLPPESRSLFSARRPMSFCDPNSDSKILRSEELGLPHTSETLSGHRIGGDLFAAFTCWIDPSKDRQPRYMDTVLYRRTAGRRDPVERHSWTWPRGDSSSESEYLAPSLLATRDGDWYSSQTESYLDRILLPQAEVKSTDQKTSYTISSEGMGLRIDFVVLGGNRHFRKYMAQRYRCACDASILGFREHGLSVSRDRRFLVFARLEWMPRPADLRCNLQFPRLVHLCLLDLRNGRQHEIAAIPPGKAETEGFERTVRECASGRQPDWYCQYERYFLPLPVVWSADGKLAALSENTLRIFETDPATGLPQLRKTIDVSATGAMNLDFWSGDTLLLFNADSLWKLEIGEMKSSPPPLRRVQ